MTYRRRLSKEDATKTQRPLRSLWVGDSLGHYEIGALLSLVRAGYSVGLYTYSQITNLPAEIEQLDAHQIIDESEVFNTTSSPGTFSGFSNLFRYRMLQVEKCIWVDTDILAGPIPLPDDSFLFGYENARTINGAVLAAPQDSELLKTLLEKSSARDPSTLKWGEIGPKMITSEVRQLGLNSLAQHRKMFYPLSYRNVWRLFDPRSRSAVENAVAQSATIHIWNEVLRKASRPLKTSYPHPDSFLGQRLAEVDLQAGSSNIIDPVWVRDTWRFEQIPLGAKVGAAIRIAKNVGGRRHES